MRRIGEEAAMWTLHHTHMRTGSSLDQLCKRLRASRQERNATAVVAALTAVNAEAAVAGRLGRPR
jgi:hypothetical protein